MGKLTGTRHADAAGELLVFYQEKAEELEESGQYFMAAVALALAVETALLGYLLVEFGDENGGELEIPDSVGMRELSEAANEIGALSAPIDADALSQIGYEGDRAPPKHIAKDVIDKIRWFRNKIHPGRALKESFDPRSFTGEQYKELHGIYESVLHSLLYNL